MESLWPEPSTVLYIKYKKINKKKKQSRNRFHKYIETPTRSHVYDTCTSQIRKTEFVSYGRPDERGRLSKHPNTEIFVGGRDVDEETL